ncbi:MAG: YidC/Oxa1 family membrane protein insertase [Acidimicrobiales bacterium]
MTALIPVLGSTLGKIFQPLFQAMAWLIAVFYALVPNYAIAIALLTVVVMIVTAPLTVKSTRSMVAMQRLSPELKKLQQKYKGDRQQLNDEMMKLYREHGVNPAGGCLPMIVQMPIFIILYDVIRGLTNTVHRGAKILPSSSVCHQTVCAAPRYIGTSSKLYQNLIHSGGKMPAFGIDLAQRVLGHHSITAALPYGALIAVAIGLQYLQMRQLNSRNPAMAQANPQAQMMQRYMPLIFAVIYINIAAGVNIYFIVSSLCRIGLQEAVFRSGVLDKTGPAAKGELPGRTGASAPKRRTVMERLADAQRQAVDAQRARQAALQAEVEIPPASPAPSTGNGRSPATGGGKPASNRGRETPSAASDSAASDSAASDSAASDSAAPASKVTHPRAKAKRTRKAR